LIDYPYPPFSWELAEFFSLLTPYNTLEDNALTKIRTDELLPKAFLDANQREIVVALKVFARLTDITSPNDPLTSISAYYEQTSDRTTLWKRLLEIFENKQEPTRTHILVANSAAQYLKSSKSNLYLIITTNYDCLMETALSKTPDGPVPYVALTMNREDGKIHARFGNLDEKDANRLLVKNKAAYPNDFVL
jgi:hypothetical protein